MAKLKLDIDDALGFISEQEISLFKDSVKNANDKIKNASGRGSDYLGWVKLPENYDKDEHKRILETAKKFREISDVLVVIGIGGSYLGARAVIDALKNGFDFLLPKDKRENPLVLYAGNSIGEDYHAELLEVLDNYDYTVAVISKSGTTTEPAIAFRLLKEHAEKKYGKDGAKQRIAAVTDKAKGALKKLADEEGYETFVIPDDVGGRYSVLTPVGLLPIAYAGYDTKELLGGAEEMMNYVDNDDILENPSNLYAVTRNILYNKGKAIEIVASYTPSLQYFIEWWKQLYGESEGKENKSIFPAGVNLTTDLHSMGQWMQQGTRNIFETVISVENAKRKLKTPKMDTNLDELDYIAGKRLNEINLTAEKGTIMAHKDGGVPVMRVSIPEISERYLGQMIYFFEKAVAVSGYILDINPFDQPGVEEYKKNMFKLLGKPGYDK